MCPDYPPIDFHQSVRVVKNVAKKEEKKNLQTRQNTLHSSERHQTVIVCIDGNKKLSLLCNYVRGSAKWSTWETVILTP